ncbi:MAG: FAD/NAD(P)-binding protein [Planctomycetes bacterium]|nr:FAD/NAD(P)-binding protein [Planctomycetota bacterium]
MRPRVAKVRATRQETRDTWTLELEVDGGAPVPFAAGQFHMLWPFGVGEAAISIAGDPGEPARVVHTVRAVGAVSRALAAARPGDALGLRGPFGRGWPVEAAINHDVLLVAGGIGLAPLRPFVLHLLSHRGHYGRAALLVGARTPGDLLYPGELDDWRARGLEVLVTVDAAAPSWPGAVGVVTRLLPRAEVDPARTVAAVCGPEVMMRVVAQELASRGVAPERTYLSMERNMRCAVAVCGHCQYGPTLLCRDGPVLTWERLRPLLAVREL